MQRQNREGREGRAIAVERTAAAVADEDCRGQCQLLELGRPCRIDGAQLDSAAGNPTACYTATLAFIDRRHFGWFVRSREDSPATSNKDVVKVR